MGVKARKVSSGIRPLRELVGVKRLPLRLERRLKTRILKGMSSSFIYFTKIHVFSLPLVTYCCFLLGEHMSLPLLRTCCFYWGALFSLRT